MRKTLFLLLAAMGLLIVSPAFAQKNEKPFVIPELREWKGGNGAFAIGDATRIVYPKNNPQLEQQIHAEFVLRESMGKARTE